jgi:hypothetical protein
MTIFMVSGLIWTAFAMWGNDILRVVKGEPNERRETDASSV